ncbi:MAG: cytochrome c [Burkholderiaceae bacterium]
MSIALRKKALVAGAVQLALLGGVLAAPAPVDDIDATLMQGIDDTAKSLDSDVTQKDAKAAADDARALVDTFARIEAHYALKPETADAAGFAHRTGELAQHALAAIDSHDFDAAGDAVQQITRSCKSCHDVYKKD